MEAAARAEAGRNSRGDGPLHHGGASKTVVICHWIVSPGAAVGEAATIQDVTMFCRPFANRRPRSWLVLLGLLLVVCGFVSAAHAQIAVVGDGGPGPVKAQHLTAELVSLGPAIAPGGSAGGRPGADASKRTGTSTGSMRETRASRRRSPGRCRRGLPRARCSFLSRAAAARAADGFWL